MPVNQNHSIMSSQFEFTGLNGVLLPRAFNNCSIQTIIKLTPQKTKTDFPGNVLTLKSCIYILEQFCS